MNLYKKINRDIKKSMIEKNKIKLDTLRSVKSAFLLEMSKDGSKELSDEVAQKIILKLLKQRKESAKIYTEQSRNDLAELEIKQSKFLEFYLPKMMTLNEIQIYINNTIENYQFNSPSDIGKCMAILMKELSGRADGKLISSIVRKKLI